MEYNYEIVSLSEKLVRDYNEKHEPMSMDAYVNNELGILAASGYEYVAGPAIFVNRHGYPVYVFTFKRESPPHVPGEGIPGMKIRDW